MTQKSVAKRLGYSSPQFISNIERGLCTPPVDKLKVLIKIYDLDKEDLIAIILQENERLLRKKL